MNPLFERVASRATCAASLALLIAACGPEPTPTDPTDRVGPPPLSGTTGLALAAQDLGPDPFEIGTSWYDYTQSSHVLSPRDHVYVLRRDGAPTARFEVQSYYDERGESGVFTLRREVAREGAWGAVEEVRFSKNVKEGDICLSATLDEVACEADAAFLVFRIVRRALPDAGFTVKEPGIFLRRQKELHSFSTDEIALVEAADLEAVTQDFAALTTAKPRPSSAADPSHSRVGWLHETADAAPRQDVNFQVTSTMHAAQWQALTLTREQETLTLTLQVMCQRVDFARQRTFDTQATREVTLTLDASTPYSGQRVALCDAEQDTAVLGQTLDTTTTPYGGLWPEDPSYDWFVEQYEGRVAIRLAPGNLLWNWTASSAGSGDTTFAPIDPQAVWDTFY